MKRIKNPETIVGISVIVGVVFGYAIESIGVGVGIALGVAIGAGMVLANKKGSKNESGADKK
jgi:hypothetical protein